MYNHQWTKCRDADQVTEWSSSIPLSFVRYKNVYFKSEKKIMIKQSSTQIFDTLHACINQNCQKSFEYLLAETFLVKIFFLIMFSR